MSDCLDKHISDAEIKRFIDNFNKDFDVKLKLNNTPFLINLYENFIDQYSSDASDRTHITKLVNIEENVIKRVDKDTKKLIDEWNIERENLFLDIIKQAFIYGYCTCQEINNETKIIRSDGK